MNLVAKLAEMLRPYMDAPTEDLSKLRDEVVGAEQRLNLRADQLQQEASACRTAMLNLQEEVFALQDKLDAAGKYLGLEFVADGPDSSVVVVTEKKATLDAALQTVSERYYTAQEVETVKKLIVIMHKLDLERQERVRRHEGRSADVAKPRRW